jgi:hypothetical protein
VMSAIQYSFASKRCYKCQEVRPIEAFWRNKAKADGRYEACAECIKQYHQDKHRQYDEQKRKGDPLGRWAQKTVYRTRKRAREKGFDFDLDKDFILSIAPTHCPVFGHKLVYDSSDPNLPCVASIDRTDSSKGYTKENVKIICRHANVVKSDLSKDELIKVIKWLQDRKDLLSTA